MDIYFTVDYISPTVYLCRDGVISSYNDPTQDAYAYISTDGQGGVIAWGQPAESIGLATNQAQALGWHFDANLGVISNYWGPADVGGLYEFTVASGGAVGYLNPYDFAGFAYDTVTGTFFGPGSLEYFPGGDVNNIADRQYRIIGQWSTDGHLLDVAVDANTLSWYVPGWNYGQGCVIAPTRRKMYFLLSRSGNVVEYDMTTHSTRIAYPYDFGFDGVCDLVWDETSDLLWFCQSSTNYDPGNAVRAYGYDPDGLPWDTGNGGDPFPPAQQECILFIDGASDITTNVNALALTGDTFIFAATVASETSGKGIYSIPKSGGTATTIATLPLSGANPISNLYVAASLATPNLTGLIRANRNAFWRAR